MDWHIWWEARKKKKKNPTIALLLSFTILFLSLYACYALDLCHHTSQKSRCSFFVNKAESMLLLAKLRVDTNWSPPPRCKERAATTTIPYFRRSTGRKAATIIPSPHKGGGGGFRNLPSTFASSSSSSSLSKLNNIALDDDDYLTPPPFDPVAYAETNIEYPWEHSIQGKDFPTIFQPLMDWFLPYIAQNLDHLSPTTTTMDRDMMLHLGGAAYISNQGSGDSSSSSQRHLPSIRMGTLVFESKKFRRIRITHYDGGETQVFNSLWYPHTHIDAPLLGINMVSFGEEGRRQLCIIDFQPLDSQHEDLALPLRHIKETHPSLNGTLSTKFYDGKYFSPHMVKIREYMWLYNES